MHNQGGRIQRPWEGVFRDDVRELSNTSGSLQKKQKPVRNTIQNVIQVDSQTTIGWMVFRVEVKREGGRGRLLMRMEFVRKQCFQF